MVNAVDTDYSYVQARLVTTNGNTKIETLEAPSAHLSADAAYYQFSNTMIETMDANDTAHVTIRFQGGAAQADIDPDGNTGTLFSGFLIG